MFDMGFDKDRTCRACTKSNVELTSLYEKLDASDGICFLEFLNELTSYPVPEDDQLPHSICWECISEARIAYNFKKKCEQSHRTLLALTKQSKNTYNQPVETITGSRDDFTAQPFNVEISKMKNEYPENASTQILNNTKRTRRKRSQSSSDETKDNNLTEQYLVCPHCSLEFITLVHLTRHLNDCGKNEVSIDETPVFEISIKSEPEDVPVVKFESPLNSLSDEANLKEMPVEFKIEIDENPPYVQNTELEPAPSFKGRGDEATTTTSSGSRSLSDPSVRSKKRKSAAEYQREYRARLKAKRDNILADSRTGGPSVRSKKRKSAAARQREYRARKKAKRGNILTDSLAVIPSTSTRGITTTHQSTIEDQLTTPEPSVNPPTAAGHSTTRKTREEYQREFRASLRQTLLTLLKIPN